MRIDRCVSVIRLYDHDANYEAKRRWLVKYGELLSVHDRQLGSDGCFVIVPDGVVAEMLRRWPDDRV